MSTFNDREQQTIKEHCGDWVLYSVDELENQLAAERAKVALAVGTLRRFFYAAEPVAQAFHESLLAEVCEVLNQSPDSLADIRREVARECAEMADQYRKAQLEKAIEFSSISNGRSGEHECRAQGAFMVSDAIRAKFGVTE